MSVKIQEHVSKDAEIFQVLTSATVILDLQKIKTEIVWISMSVDMAMVDVRKDRNALI
jgi:archaellum component FlaC